MLRLWRHSPDNRNLWVSIRNPWNEGIARKDDLGQRLDDLRDADPYSGSDDCLLGNNIEEFVHKVAELQRRIPGQVWNIS
jgi:hypothetical protein